MIQKDKELLLKYLCAALPYKVIIEYNNDGCVATREMGLGSLHDFMIDNAEVKPYLRPMSSMTEEEKETYYTLCYDEEIEEFEFGDWVNNIYYHDTIESIDWLNAHHFDYRGLIPEGLAIKVTESNNPYK